MAGQGRPLGSKNVGTLEYVQLYDRLAKEYGCPVEALFKIVKGKYKPEHKVKAASTLVSYRYPKLVSQNIDAGEQGTLSLVWSDGKPA